MAADGLGGRKTTSWPMTGCDRVSAGCDHCYALAFAERLRATGQPRYQADGDPRTSGHGFGLTLHPDPVDLPRRWCRPATRRSGSATGHTLRLSLPPGEVPALDEPAAVLRSA